MAASAALDGIEIQKDRLYWLSASTQPRDTEEAHYFSIDNILVYEPLVNDLGPVDIGMTQWYCTKLHARLCSEQLANKKIIHCCSEAEDKRANAAYLICAYMVVVKGVPAEEAFQPFQDNNVEFPAFRDVSRTPSNFPLTILDCLRGLEAGIRLGWFDWKSFNLGDYAHYQQVHNGDMNWIIPGKFLAFAGPLDESLTAGDDTACTPSDLVPIFKAKGVQVVVRLNAKQYNAEDFISNGIMHTDIIFKDGSCPSDAIIKRFMFVAERAATIAVHCKAGLGRTGTLIGLYAMKHYGITAMDYIAWSRLCRPGSVIGPQQQFLCDMELMMAGHGASLAAEPLSLSGYPGEEQRNALAARIAAAGKYTDVGQGEFLVRAKQEADVRAKQEAASNQATSAR